MRIESSLEKILKPDDSGIVHISSNNRSLKRPEVLDLIDKLLKFSATVRENNDSGASAISFFCSVGGSYTLKVQDSSLLGFLKAGYRTVFHITTTGAVREINPLCVLDFHVFQPREGTGKEIFDAMLKAYSLQAQNIALNNPTVRLLSFMHKHYNLSEYVPQNNRVIVYKEFFDKLKITKKHKIIHQKQLLDLFRSQETLKKARSAKHKKVLRSENTKNSRTKKCINKNRKS